MRTQQGVCSSSTNYSQFTSSYRSLNKSEASLIVQAYGSQSSANFIFQDTVSYYGQESKSVIGYAQHHGLMGTINIVFTNPVCLPSELNSLLAAFLINHSIPTLFIGVDKSVAEALALLGYRANQIGVESYIELSTFDTIGKQKKQLRHASNFANRHACRVNEIPWKAVDSAQVLKLSGEWRATKGVSHRELKLLTRPPVFEDETMTRKFYCLQGNKLLGFVYFEPYFEKGEIKGYCANIIRSLIESEYAGVSDYIILQAIKQFRSEGVKEISLGLSPLYNIEPEENDRTTIRLLLKLMYRHANSLYSFKGLAYHKTRYRPVQEPRYLCSKELSMPKLFGALFFGLGVL